MLNSIATLSFNQGCHIEETLWSVLSQNYSRVEYILAGRGSTDGTVDIRKKHENRLAGWVTGHDKGQTDVITGNRCSQTLRAAESKISAKYPYEARSWNSKVRRLWSPY